MNPLEKLPSIKIPMKGKNKGKFIIVDGDYDGEYFSGFEWRLLNSGYGYRLEADYEYPEEGGWRLKKVNGKAYKESKKIYLAREVARPPKGMWVKHINGNKLDNRSCNLKIISPEESAITRPLPKHHREYTGVKRQTSSINGKRWVSKNRWVAILAGKHLGTFDNKREAAVAYNLAAIEKYGLKARINNIKEQ